MIPGVVRTGQFCAYAVFRVIESCIRALPLGVVFRFGNMLGNSAYVLMPGYRRLVRQNLETAFGGERPPAELDRITRNTFCRLGANLLSGIKVAWMSEKAMEERLEIEGRENVVSVIGAGGGVIYAISHMGCWEMLAQMPEIAPGLQRRASLYQALQNPFFDRHVKRLREREGLELMDRKGGFSKPVTFLKEGNGLGVLVDQHAGDKGVWTPFFGRLASTSHLAALLSVRSGAILFPVALQTVGTARWKMRIGGPVTAGEETSPEALTAELNQRVAALIADFPEDWFWVHRRWKTPQPNFLLRHYKRGICLPTGMKDSDLKPFRILVRSPNWLGDACMAVPAVRAMKRGRPDAHITVLTQEKLAGFWRQIQEVDAVVERGGKEGVFAVGRKLKEAGAFDAGVLLPNSVRSALEMKFGGVREIVGFAGKFRRKLLTKVAKKRGRPGPVEHHSKYYLRLARELGADIKEPGLFDPIDGGDHGEKLRIGLCAGAEYGAAKRWPVERFAEVAKQLCEENPGCEWVFFGVAGDAGIGGELEAAIPDQNYRNLIGKTSLEELIEELKTCRLLLTNDTGTMHLAALLGVRTVSVFGSTDPRWTGPLGDGHTVVRRHAECSPCFLRECPIDFRCMKDVGVEEVAGAVKNCLS